MQLVAANASQVSELSQVRGAVAVGRGAHVGFHAACLPLGELVTALVRHCCRTACEGTRVLVAGTCCPKCSLPYCLQLRTELASAGMMSDGSQEMTQQLLRERQALRDEASKLRGDLQQKDQVLALLQEQLKQLTTEVDLDGMLAQLDKNVPVGGQRGGSWGRKGGVGLGK